MICGPTSTGKTTLAERIIAESPYDNKVLLSYDQILRDFIETHHLPKERYYIGLSPEENREFQEERVDGLMRAFQQHCFTVYEGWFENYLSLRLFIEFLPLVGLDRPLTVLKMWPSLELQKEFGLNRTTDREYLSLDTIMNQRHAFRDIIDHRPISDVKSWVNDIVVCDPRELSIEFLT